MEQKLLSLCIPTNGVSEWVFPVLDSIFSQNIDERLYEVIVTDNGENKDFQNKVQEYKLLHSNFIYQQTSAFQFLNQVEAFRLANGLFIKFVNHRTVMKPGTIKYLLDLVEQNKKEKPVIFFLNGKKNINNNMEIYPDFNQFIKGLSYWSSWSGGIACWKEDFEKIPSDIMYNELFPHTTILFYERKKQICN